ncbi:uncharacterized protein EV422DRAFT_525558 [Fimicolochytrium jonesii]|uniref:uncharacterized protein n=1 Tax=Fimicolochytrium jonesii TaxID=1396493 RepID=UPI0022FE537A|nr:uncharacterized protein EV422DRAFT_525558 [Fimicolochytrium jonesii]KAI8822070.1 hypothetical protein EV422DRAFT_525558 [Fimicolochytrium jonesii]
MIMGRKVIYKLERGNNAREARDESPTGPEGDNLPKKTRTLLLKSQLATKNKDYAQLDKLLGELGDLYEEAEDLGKTIQTAKKELSNAAFLKGREAEMAKTRAYYRMCTSYRKLDQFAPALTFCTKYITCAEKLRDVQDQLQGHIELGLIHIARFEANEQHDEAELNAAMTAFKSASKLISHIPRDRKGPVRANLNLNIGITLNHSNQPDRALEFFEKALALYKKDGNKPHEAMAYFNMSLAYHKKKDIEQSIRHLWLEQRIWHDLGNVVEEARALWEVAVRNREGFKYLEAIQTFRSYIGLCQIIDDAAGRSKARAAIEETNECIEKERRVVELTETYNQICKVDENQNIRRKLELLDQRGKLLLDLGKHGPALKDFLEEKQFAYKLSLNKSRIGEILANIGTCYAAIDRHAEALRVFRDALHEFVGADEDRLHLLLQLADSSIRVSETYDVISRTLEEALKLARKLGDLDAQREALIPLRAVARAHGAAARAKGYDEQLLQVEQLLAASKSDTQGDSVEPRSDLTVDDEVLNQAGFDDDHMEMRDGEQNPKPAMDEPTTVSAHQPSSSPPPHITTQPIRDRTSKYKIHLIDSDIDEPLSPPRLRATAKRTAETTSAPVKVIELLSPSPKRSAEVMSPVTGQSIAKRRMRVESSPDPPELQDSFGYLSLPGPALRTVDENGPAFIKSDSQCVLDIDGPFIDPSTAKPLNNSTQLSSAVPSSQPRPPHLRLPLTPSNPQLTPLSRRHPTPSSTDAGSVASFSTPIHRSRSNPSQSQTKRRKPPLKIRVVLGNAGEEETLAIPCPDGPTGTPKTVGWVVEEARRRYKDIYHTQPPIMKIMTTDPETNEEETLGGDDIVEHVLVNKQKIRCINRPG